MRAGTTVRLISLTIFLVASLATLAPAAEPPRCQGKRATIWGKTGEINGTHENDIIVGSTGKDIIKGVLGQDTICGKGGDDDIFGGGGLDSLEGGSGEDHLDGGSETDTVSYAYSPAFVKVNLSLRRAVTSGEIDNVVEIEEVRGSKFDDVLTGDPDDNDLFGGVGDDSLFGQGGDDVLEGDAGDDIIAGGSGKNTMNGESGDDTASYRGAAGPVVVNLQLGRGVRESDADTLRGFENVAGSDFGDGIIGNGQPNQLLGYKGSDNIQGGPEADLIDGGAEDDIMFGGDGLDTIVGGEHGNVGDTVSYEDAYGPVTANLSTGVAQPDGWGQSDQLIEVENLIGSYGIVDFTGDDRKNTIVACNHADRVNGLGGDDTIYGGLDSDTIDGGPGNDTIYGEHGNDTLTGSTENDQLIGGIGNDHLDGQEGIDVAYGGEDANDEDHDTCFAETVNDCENEEQTSVARIGAGRG